MAAPTVTIRSWPLRDEPLRSWAMLAVIIVASIISGRFTSSWATGALTLAALMVVAWQIWVPTTFELGSKGVVRRVLIWRHRIAWSEFSQYEQQLYGVFLRHNSDSGPLAAMNGLFLPSRPPHSDLTTLLDFYLKPRGTDAPITTQTLAP